VAFLDAGDFVFHYGGGLGVFEFEFDDVRDDGFKGGAGADDAGFEFLAFGHDVWLLVVD